MVTNYCMALRGSEGSRRGGNKEANVLLPITFLVGNFVSLLGLYFFHNHGKDFFASLVFLQALIIPIFYAISVNGKKVFISNTVLWGHAIACSLGAIVFFFSAFFYTSSLNYWFVLAWHHWFSAVMFVDGVVLLFAGILYIFSENSSVGWKTRLSCALLSLVLPLGPLGLNIFLYFRNKRRYSSSRYDLVW
eukprot:TRINITY_DN4277_c0_g1_i5.p1 TRINITY_DN4277_c0_g1~~TRINITY_DN4277_c0_g1_i5.p1  ORF type:complete len:191 (+),score=22.67 TRINITY_DN4277_c0_g1_i5:398-970(+)